MNIMVEPRSTAAGPQALGRGADHAGVARQALRRNALCALCVLLLAIPARGGQPAIDADIIFAERNPGVKGDHYYSNFGYSCTNPDEWLYGDDGARLCRLDPQTGRLTVLLEDARGGIRDPQVSYDAKRILFSYRKGGTHHFNLWEINADGGDLRQITTGDWDDIEPCYLPDGGIAFCSSRCNRYVMCWYTMYSSASPLMDKIGGHHHDAKLTADEQMRVRLWIDTAAQYAGTYAALGTGQIGAWWHNNEPIREMADAWPTTAPARDAVERRCADCHGKMLPRFVTDRIPVDPYGDFEGWQRPTSRFSRHTVFNLTKPAGSLMLMAPLAKAAGGYAAGKQEQATVREDRAHAPKAVDHPVIFETVEDPDYVKILAHLRAAGQRLDEIGRFDMPGFKPSEQYVREMKRYGVLPAGFDPVEDPADVYAIDRNYWQSLWWRPETKGSARTAEEQSQHDEAGHTDH